MSIKVMKFGGTSIGNIKRMKHVTELISKRIKAGNKKILMVVSAMSGVTNKLVKEYMDIENNICKSFVLFWFAINVLFENNSFSF